MADAAQVKAALGRIVDPASGKDLISAGTVAGVQVSGGTVSFALQVAPEQGAAMEPLRKAAEAAVAALPGVEKVLAVLTAHAGAAGDGRGEVPDLGTGGAAPAAEAAALPRFARVIRLDENDETAYAQMAEPGEWAVSGAFAFMARPAVELAAAETQDFANGWLGLGSWGRAALVAVTPISEDELAALVELLAQHFVERYGAPDLAAARVVAAEEVAHMAGVCAGHEPDTVMMVDRKIEDGEIAEKLHVIRPMQPEGA